MVPLPDKSYAAIVLSLVVLAVVAGWQFYSLAWGETAAGSYMVDRGGKNLPDDPTSRRTPAVSPK